LKYIVVIKHVHYTHENNLFSLWHNEITIFLFPFFPSLLLLKSIKRERKKTKCSNLFVPICTCFTDD